MGLRDVPVAPSRGLIEKLTHANDQAGFANRMLELSEAGARIDRIRPRISSVSTWPVFRSFVSSSSE